MSSPQFPRIAVIGAGPSGCYISQALTRQFPGAELTVFDRLASPYGLVRYGVAADHQHTKAITRQFERLFASPGVRFAGGIEIGKDITLATLQRHYDAIVIATGLTADRELDLPGSSLPGVVGAGTITRILNAHPDEPSELPSLGPEVVLIGAGNVSLDVLRFLVKDAPAYTGSDVSDPALASYLADPASRITVISRSSAADSKGDPQMIRELATLPRGYYESPDGMTELPSAEPETGPAARTREARLSAFAALTAPTRNSDSGPRVTLRFGYTPTRILGDTAVTGVELARPNGELIRVPATSVVTAIGFTTGDSSLCASAAPSESGRYAAGIYRTGWAKRGPQGAIPENRACAKSVADEIAADVAAGKLTARESSGGFCALPQELRTRAVSYEEWLTLEAHERAQAGTDRIRAKVPDHTTMAAIAKGAVAPTS